MFKDYQKDIKEIKNQHNIMVFIGNGFDISVLRKYRDDNLITSYSKFYDYLCYKEFNEDNILFSKMKEEGKKDLRKENWCDFESLLGELLESGVPTDKLNDALEEIQHKFLLFLNDIVTPDILLNLDRDRTENGFGIKALSRFLGDLDKEDYKKINFPKKTNHYHMYNYLFINFNYTSLFDNYIYLDKYQFDPHPYERVDRNFQFYPYTKRDNGNDTIWSSYIMTDIIHPHGYQNIPKSLLFGVEDKKYASYKKFNKSYWAQDNLKYNSYFYDAELFIIYGASMGETDSWWWKNIYDSLLCRESELIIYYYEDGEHNYNKDDIKQKFINGCKVNSSEEDILHVKQKIYVVLYDKNRNLNMFGLHADT